jgi:hypothetical protein
MKSAWAHAGKVVAQRRLGETVIETFETFNPLSCGRGEDTESEREIQRALEKAIRGRTVLAVAHRLSTLLFFDRIIVLMDGKIVEDGAPVELFKRGGVFSSLWRMQGQGLSIDDALERTIGEALAADGTARR